MSHNINNFGQVIGRLTREPQVFVNSDGSRKVMFTVAARRNFKNSDDQWDSDFVSLEAFVSASCPGLGVYDYMHKGDPVAVTYTVQTSSYPDKKTGEMIYKTVLLVRDVSLQSKRREQNTEA